MSTLETQYKNYQNENPNSKYTFEEWMEKVNKPFIQDIMEQVIKQENEKHQTRNTEEPSSDK